MKGSDSNTHPLLSLCENRRQREFYDELSSFEKNSEEWNEFLKLNCGSVNCFISMSAFEEIGKSGDPRWISLLFEWLNTDHFSLSRSQIFCAIGNLGGFQSKDDYAHYFEATDNHFRAAAMNITDFLPEEDAIELLLEILESDQDPHLRRFAAERLAYLGSNAGLQLLLDDFESSENHSLFSQLNTACALSVLKHPIGLRFLHNLIKSHLILSTQSRTTLLHCVLGLLVKVGIELPPCDRPADVPVESIFRTATEWIEARS